MNYGKAIKEVRVNKMKQKQIPFAEAIGITQTYLSLIEKGHKKPSTDLLEKVSEYVDVPLVILFWFALTEEDVKPNRKEAFALLKPVMDKLIQSCF